MMNALTKFDDATIQRIFGHEAAENEEPARLREYYFKSDTYERIVAGLPLRILVGHKGIGKSALFKVALQEDEDARRLSLLIRPDDIIELGLDGTDFLRMIRDWKAGLTEIVAGKVFQKLGIRHDERVQEQGTRVLSFLMEKIEPVRRAVTSGEKQSMIDKFLKDHLVNVYIDDLDRGWSGNRTDVLRISALLNALRDLSNDNRGLRFKVALRTDVYFLVRTADESTDKLEGSVVWQSWTNHEILALLAKRILTFRGLDADEASLLAKDAADLSSYLDFVMEERFEGKGHWKNAPMYTVLMSLIRKRPRDLVKLCSLGAQRAQKRGRKRIGAQDFEEVFEEYSQGRLQDTINEYRTELPDIQRLLMGMRPSAQERKSSQGYNYKTDALLRKIRNIEEQGAFKLASGRVAASKDLAQFMYKINFLVARKVLSPNETYRKYFEENRYLLTEFADFGLDWEIHPAYRWALQPATVHRIFHELQLSNFS